MKKRRLVVLALVTFTCICATSCLKFETCTCEDTYGNTAVVSPEAYGVDNCSDACWKWQGYGK